MSGSRRSGLLVILATCCCGLACLSTTTIAAENATAVNLGNPAAPAAVAGVSARWKGYGSDIQTAEIEYLSLFVVCQDLPLRPERALEMLREVDWSTISSDEEVVQELLWRFRPDMMHLRDDDEMLDWVQRMGQRKTLLWRGDDRRYVTASQEHVVHRDVHLLVDRLNEDVQAYRHGGCPIWYDNLTWWRAVPDADLPTVATVLSPSTGKLDFYYLNVPGEKASLASLNAQHGLPEFWRHYDVAHDKLRRLDLFNDYTTFPGDVLFPAVRAEINVQEGRVRNIQLNLVRDARFNIDLPDERFQLQVPEGWAWFDWRQSEKEAGTWESGMNDAAKFFRNRVPAPKPAPASAPAESGFNWRSLMFLVNGLLLVTIGLYLWRRS